MSTSYTSSTLKRFPPLFALFIFFFAHTCFALESHPEVWVELKSGMQQKATLLGIQGDTVLLGGKVDGKDRIVRLPKDRFKRILSLPDSTPIDLQKPQTIAAVKTDVEDTIQHDSAQAFDWLGHFVVLPPETQGLDSTQQKGIFALLRQIMHDRGGFPVLSPTQAELAQLGTPEALIKKMKEVGALGILGSQWKMKDDSIHVQFRTIWTRGDSVQSTKASRGTKMDLSRWLLSTEPWTALEKSTGIIINSKPKQSRASLWVDTDPDGALVSINGQAPSCKAPCRVMIPTDTAMRATVWASWKVENHLWAGKTYIAVSPGDSLHTLVKLQPNHATILLTTHPAGADVYAESQDLSTSNRQLGQTPFSIDEFEPGELQWRISLQGYRDSIIKIVPDPTGHTSVQINLQPLSAPAEIATQAAQYNARTKIRLGKVMFGVSAAPLLLGTTMLYMASRDFDHAKNIKANLEAPSTGSGPNYLAQVQANHDAVHAGNVKQTIGGTLLGLGGILAVVGFSLWF